MVNYLTDDIESNTQDFPLESSPDMRAISLKSK